MNYRCDVRAVSVVKKIFFEDMQYATRIWFPVINISWHSMHVYEWAGCRHYTVLLSRAYAWQLLRVLDMYIGLVSQSAASDMRPTMDVRHFQL